MFVPISTKTGRSAVKCGRTICETNTSLRGTQPQIELSRTGTY
ncbi:hypothetical protein F441_09120 [Phytophthora nicotianae CJ01A1]|uniref:Uncharacterized protein n=1 Tax=Phytophthora nicotianae CJ01A1 TaxID=1317063 RepID=W2X0G7_PHYNI|nr:hypothetical protein F441_09120 [Phytophthora nicotianae CJ01A1]